MDGGRDVKYKRIYDLKFNQCVPTFELRKRFPKEGRKITRVALLQLSNSVLRELVHQKKELQKLMLLRRSLFKQESGRHRKAAA